MISANRLPVLFLLYLALALPARAAVFNFEDALQTLGHGGDPANFYQAQGLTFSGSYFGLIEGVSNGNADNFRLEGTNGPASLAATSVVTLGEVIELNFASPASTLCFDLGAAWFSELQTPDPLQIRVRSYLGAAPQGDRTITVEDTLKEEPGGTWYPQSFALVDRVHLEAVAGNGTWAIDNIVTDAPCPAPGDNGDFFIPIIGNNGSVTIINL